MLWAWWLEQLLDILPGRLAQRLAETDDGLLVAAPWPDDGGAPASVRLSERLRGIERELGRFELDGSLPPPARSGAVLLVLPTSDLLEREVLLPAAAERDLDRILFHEMGRLTPFTAEEVYWHSHISRRDRAQGKILLVLSLVLRAPLGLLLPALSQAGLAPSALEIPLADGHRRRIKLQREDAEGSGGRRWLMPALLGCAALLMVAVVLPFILQGLAAAAVERQIATTAPIVARVQELRRHAYGAVSGSEVVAAERKRAGDALEALALLTDALPDNTFLTAVTFDAGKLTLDGQSKAAATLIAAVSANPRLRNPAFTAPVVRNTLNGDVFSMRVEVAP